MQKILVSSNCQTAGIAVALRVMLPNAEISAIPVPPDGNQDIIDKIQLALNSTDTWITSNEKIIPSDNKEKINTIVIPKVIFRAFHPDLSYIHSATTNNAIKGPGNSDYHSNIVFSCAKRNKDKKFTINMFENSTFNKLNYYNYWEIESKKLRELFRNTHIDFHEFMSKVAPSSPFMHSVNHPNSNALCQIARQVARKLNASQTMLDAPIERSIQDTLSGGDIWPIYPEIAEKFGLSGSYIWKIGNSHFCRSIEEYVDLSYSHYQNYDLQNTYSRWHDENILDNIIEQN